MKSLFSLYTITYTKTYSQNSKYKKKGQLSLFLVGIVIIIIMTIITFFKKTTTTTTTSFLYLIMIS